AAVGLRPPPLDEAAPAEAAEDPAQVARVEAERLAQRGRRGRFAVGDLVEDARLGEREGAVEQPLPQHADLPGGEAGEPPAGAHAGIGPGHARLPGDGCQYQLFSCSSQLSVVGRPPAADRIARGAGPKEVGMGARAMGRLLVAAGAAAGLLGAPFRGAAEGKPNLTGPWQVVKAPRDDAPAKIE